MVEPVAAVFVAVVAVDLIVVAAVVAAEMQFECRRLAVPVPFPFLL